MRNLFSTTIALHYHIFAFLAEMSETFKEINVYTFIQVNILIGRDCLQIWYSTTARMNGGIIVAF